MMRVIAHIPKRLPSSGADRIGLASEATLQDTGRIGFVPRRREGNAPGEIPSVPQSPIKLFETPPRLFFS
jgi:hypothetical protein